MGCAEALLEEQTFNAADGPAHGPDAARLPDPDVARHARSSSRSSSSRIDPEGPYGAKEAGEGPLHPAIPAIANAIYDAVGVRIDRCRSRPAQRARGAARAKRARERPRAGRGCADAAAAALRAATRPRTLDEALGAARPTHGPSAHARSPAAPTWCRT